MLGGWSALTRYNSIVYPSPTGRQFEFQRTTYTKRYQGNYYQIIIRRTWELVEDPISQFDILVIRRSRTCSMWITV
jgi:hypothetical protein